MRLSLLALALSACALLACGDDDETDGSGGAGATSSSSGSGTGASGGEPAGPGGTGGTASGSGGEGGGQGGGSGDMTLESSAFTEGMPIPEQYECLTDAGAGENISPPLSWTPGPAGTQSYAVILRDLDFMNGFLHWVIWDIPASATSLPEGVEGVFEPGDPAGAKQAPFGNAGIVGYFGPCSPNSVNTYQFTVYALDVATLPGLDDQSSIGEAEDAILAEEIASATLSGES